MSHQYKARPTAFHRKTIVAGVAAAIGAGSAGLSWSAELEEVVVTARQRAESSQDIPMMVQSLSGEEIQKARHHNARRFFSTSCWLECANHGPGQNIRLSSAASVTVAASSSIRLPRLSRRTADVTDLRFARHLSRRSCANRSVGGPSVHPLWRIVSERRGPSNHQ